MQTLIADKDCSKGHGASPHYQSIIFPYWAWLGSGMNDDILVQGPNGRERQKGVEWWNGTRVAPCVCVCICRWAGAVPRQDLEQLEIRMPIVIGRNSAVTSVKLCAFHRFDSVASRRSVNLDRGGGPDGLTGPRVAEGCQLRRDWAISAVTFTGCAAVSCAMVLSLSLFHFVYL